MKLTRGADLARVRTRGKRFRGDALELRAIAAIEPGLRFGIIVPRYEHTAVSRNLVKRRIREIIRAEREASPVAGEVAVFALRGAYGRSFAQLRDEFVRLFRRIDS